MCFCRRVCQTHLFAVLAGASSLFCSCSSCTSRQRPQSAEPKAEAQTNSTLGGLGGIFDQVCGLRRGGLLLDIPPSSFRCDFRAHTERTNKPGLIFVVPTFALFRRLLRLRCPGNDTHSQSPARLAVRCATGGLPCLNSSARRHSKRTKLTMRTWPQEKGPGFRERSGGAQHSSLRGAEGSARRSCHAKAALQSHRNRKRQHHTLNPACRYA